MGYKLTLVDYADSRVEVDLGTELDEIAVINIHIITGDEIAEVIYKDYTTRSFYSNHADTDFYDGEYEIYRFDGPKEDQLLFNEKWLNRKSSYDWWDGFDEDEDE